MPDGRQPEGMQRQHGCVFRIVPIPRLPTEPLQVLSAILALSLVRIIAASTSGAYDRGGSTRKVAPSYRVYSEIKRAPFRTLHS